MRTSGFPNVLKALLVLVFAALMSGCAVIGVGIGDVIGETIAEGESDKLTGTIEVGEIKINGNIHANILKSAKLSSAIFDKDMKEQNTSPSPTDVKVHTIVTEEVKRSMGNIWNNTSPVTIRLKTTFFVGGSISGFYYYQDNTEKKSLSYMQKNGVRKAVNTRLLLEQDGNMLLEVHGLWVAGNQGDEIAGARQLARELANAVLKKLNAPQKASM